MFSVVIIMLQLVSSIFCSVFHDSLSDRDCKNRLECEQECSPTYCAQEIEVLCGSKSNGEDGQDRSRAALQLMAKTNKKGVGKVHLDSRSHRTTTTV